MKKIIVIVLILITLTGCNKLMNTPTKKVEAMLNNYVTLNKDVLDDLVSNQIPKLTSVINDANFKIRLYNNYVNEYNQYKDEYERKANKKKKGFELTKDELRRIIENACTILKIDDTKIYRISYLNYLIKKEVKKKHLFEEEIKNINKKSLTFPINDKIAIYLSLI